MSSILVTPGPEAISLDASSSELTLDPVTESILLTPGASEISVNPATETISLVAAEVLTPTILTTSISDFTLNEVMFFTQRPSDRPVTRINIVLQGSATPTVTWELRKASTLNAVGTVIHTATTTSITSGDTITAISLPAIAVDDYIWFLFTAKGGTLLAFNPTISFG